MSSTTSQTDFDVPSPTYLFANLKLFETLPPNSSSSSLPSSSLPSSSSSEEEGEEAEKEINKMNSIDDYGKKVLKFSHNITKLNKTDEDLLMMIVSEEYKMPIFVLSLFSVHYIGWMKGGNNKYLADFMQRFSHIYERILLLPEFDDDEKNLLGQTDGELNDTVIDLATELSRNYRRQLVLTFHNINGLIKTNKKIRVTLIQEMVDNEVGEKDEKEEEESDDDDDSFTVTALSSSSSSSSSELNSEEEDDAVVVVDSTSSQDGRKDMKEHEDEESKVNVNNIILGEVNLVEDVQYVLDIPEATNSPESTQIYFKLSLMDSDDPTNREYIRIKISEALISGYTGLRRKFDITLNEEIGEAVMECFEFELTANWRIDPKSYREIVKEPVELLEKLSGVIFVLGEYYWYFCSGFYKWALFDLKDSIVRYTAIQIFHELCLMLSPTLLHDQMTNIYRSMYPLGGYPQLRTLPSFTESSYLLESFSVLDNVMHVFVYLSTHEQIEVVRRLLSHATLLLANRFRFIARLVGLLRASIANYPTKDAAEVINPFVTSLLNHLALIAKPEHELADPRPDRPITWKMVNALSGNLCNLLVECIKCARSKQSKLLSIDDYKMTGVRVLLNLTIQALFNQKGVSFLKSIFIRLYARKVLDEAHLTHFVTSDRVKQYREWMEGQVNVYD